MAKFNLNTYESGEEYTNRLYSEASKNFKILLALLSSYWQSTTDGPNYARELKAIAIEISRLKVMLDNIQTDINFSTVRTEFLYQVLTSMLFPQAEGSPDTGDSDTDFKIFLNKIVRIYFAGSIPDSIQKAMELIAGGTIVVKENFEETRNGSSGFDISDQFGFTIDILMSSPSEFNVFMADKNARILLAIIRPAHTLYKINYILQETYIGTGPGTSNPPSNLRNDKIGDVFRWSLSNYGYEDFRKFVNGVYGVDHDGFKKPISIVGEDHTGQF